MIGFRRDRKPVPYIFDVIIKKSFKKLSIDSDFIL